MHHDRRRRPRAARAATGLLTTAAACAALACSTSHASVDERAERVAAAPRIVVDGKFDDWVGAATVDDVDDVDDPGDASARVDFRALAATADGEALYVRFTTAAPIVLAQLGSPTHVLFDLDGSSATGAAVDGLDGVDLHVVLSPGVDAWAGGGAGMRVPGGALTFTDAVGYVGAPTHAATAFELRIERAGASSFADVPVGDRARVRLVAYTPEGQTVDATETVAFDVPPALVAAAAGAPPAKRIAGAHVAPPVDVIAGARVAAASPVTPSAAALARAPGTDVRVVQWNVADRGIVVRPEPFARLLRALDADVLLLDELPRDTDEAAVRAFLARVGGDWHVVLGDGGGRQHAAVASRLPLSPAPAFARVAYPDSVHALAPLATRGQTRRDLASAGEDGLSVAGAVAVVRGARILFVAADLACCGGQHDVEDRLRRIQARALHGAARAALAAERVDAVVVAGDLNLVGSARPLEILRAGLDPEGGDLATAYALQLDGRSTATWRSPGQAFPPGRLDWLLYAPSSLDVARAFAFETADLSVDVLRAAGIEPADSDDTSDHLPLVVDLRVRR
jgi:hypothetical protein